MNTNMPAAALEPRKLASGRGWDWLAEAFSMFMQAPGVWIGIAVIYVIIFIAASAVPGGSLLTTLFGPTLTAGIVLGSHSQATGQGVKLEHLFAAFSGGRLGSLVVLALIYVGALLVLFLLAALIAIAGLGLSPANFKAGNFEDYILPLLLVVLVLLALYIPVLMGMWLAPALIVLRGMEPVAAFTLSFRACLVNFMPFLIYGLAGLVLCLLATLPLCLGWLVLLPVICISIYTSYRDMFPEALPPPLQAEPPAPPAV
jgi:uncharacterized membrane protein